MTRYATKDLSKHGKAVELYLPVLPQFPNNNLPCFTYVVEAARRLRRNLIRADQSSPRSLSFSEDDRKEGSRDRRRRAAAVPSLDAGDGTEHITHVVHKTATLSSKAPRSCLGLLHFFHPRKYFAPPRFEPVVVSSFSCVNVNEST